MKPSLSFGLTAARTLRPVKAVKTMSPDPSRRRSYDKAAHFDYFPRQWAGLGEFAAWLRKVIQRDNLLFV